MTTRRTRGADRTASVVVGAGLLALGAAAWDWRLGLTGLVPDTALDASSLESVTGSAWWPWAFAGAGILLGVLGIVWLLAHVPRLTSSTSRLSTSAATGRLEVDHGSLGSTLADRWSSLAPVTGARARTMPEASDVIVLTGHVEVEADPADLVAGTAQVEREVAGAFPEGEVRVRFLLEGTVRQPRTRRSTTIAVDEGAAQPS